MELGKIIGTVNSTIQDASLRSYRLVLVQEYNLKSKKLAGTPYVAIDKYGCGTDSYVCVTKGSQAQKALDGETACDAVVVGIVDDINLIG